MFVHTLVQLRSQSVSKDWCDWEGKPASWAGPLPSVHTVSSGSVYASPSMLRFRDPNNFSAGNLSNCLPCWEPVLQDYPKTSEIYSFLSEGVNVKQFFVPFHGTFQGRHFSRSYPPSMAFPNSPSCERFKDFILAQFLIEFPTAPCSSGEKWVKLTHRIWSCPLTSGAQ